MTSELTSIGSLEQKTLEFSQMGTPFFDTASSILRKIIDTYDMQEYIELEHRHLADDPSAKSRVDDERKFFDLPFWIYNKSLITSVMGLTDRASCRILDLGSGPGHFMLISKLLGHEVHGLDIPLPVYDDICNFFKLERTHHAIIPFEPLPKSPKKFDFVTGFYVNFNTDHYTRNDEHRGKTAWGVEEWNYFISDIANNLLTPDGKIYLLLNPVGSAEKGLRAADGSLLGYFRDIGATIVNQEIGIVKITNFSKF